MTIIEQKLVQKSKDIFETVDKWNALVELQGLTGEIIKHWMEIGTKELRKYFMKNPSDGWCCAPWNNNPIFTKWYLKEFGSGSLAIGYDWAYHFNLLSADFKRFDSNLIDEQLKTEKYRKLLTRFGVDPKLKGDSDRLVTETFYDFTFEQSLHWGDNRELAWYAVHRTDDFVKQAAGKIERFTHDPEMTRLITELNAEAQKKLPPG